MNTPLEVTAAAHQRMPNATWERIVQQFRLSSPPQRPAPRMPAFLLPSHPASCSELTPSHQNPPYPISPPRQCHQPASSNSFTFLSSTTCETPSPENPSPRQHSVLPTVSTDRSSLLLAPPFHVNDTVSTDLDTLRHLCQPCSHNVSSHHTSHSRTAQPQLLPPSAFAVPAIKSAPVEVFHQHQPCSVVSSQSAATLDLSDPATQRRMLQARDSLRDVIQLKILQRYS